MEISNTVLAHAAGNKNQQKIDLKHNNYNYDPSSQAHPNKTLIHNPILSNAAQQPIESGAAQEEELNFQETVEEGG